MDIRYLAGLFDGEGYVRIVRYKLKPPSPHIRYNLQCGIGMTHRPVIEAIRTKFGGHIQGNRHDLRNPRARIQFCWTISSQIAAEFLRRIQPHSIVKRDEIDLALEFQNHIDDTPYIRTGRRGGARENSEAILAFREECFRRISALKKRSFPPLTEQGAHETAD